MRREIPLLITMMVGWFMVLEYFFPWTERWSTELQNWAIIMTALASVLETLRLSEPRGRRVLILGDMLELGPMKAALHREAGRRAAAAGVQALIAVGPLSRETADAARRAGLDQVQHHPDSADCAESIGEFLREGDLVVIKGSRGMHMERVVQALIARAEEAH